MIDCVIKQKDHCIPIQEIIFVLPIKKHQIIWIKFFKNGPNKVCGRRSLKNFTWSILEYHGRYKPYDINTVKVIYSGGNTMVLAAASDFLEIKRAMVKVS